MSSNDALSDRAFIQRSARFGITSAVVVGVLLALLWLLKSALTPFAVAWVLAYLLDPLIDRFEARGIRRSPAILLLLLLAGSATVGVAFFVIPALQRELATVTERLPGYLETALGTFAPTLERTLGIELPNSLREGVDALRRGELQLPLETVRSLLERSLKALTGTVGALVSALLIPVLGYYLLVEFDRIRLAVLNLVPVEHQTLVAEKAETVDRLISSFIRGQLLVCATLGVLYAVGFAVIGVDLALFIGILSGLLAIIPYVGGAVALASAAGMCLLQFGLDLHLALVVGWYALVQTLEGMVLTPRIVGRSVGMHPVTVILALMIGADLLGFLGLLIAVPLAAVVQVFAHDGIAAYRRSLIYRGSGAAG